MFPHTMDFSKEASIIHCTRNCVNISHHDEFTLRNNLSYISAFVYESLPLSPLYVKLPVTVKSPFMVVFPVVKSLSVVVSLYNVILLVVDNPMYAKTFDF